MFISDGIDHNTDNKNPYEDARNQRLLENKRRFEELGISKISKSLQEAAKALKKPTVPRTSTSRPKITEMRRSSRERNAATYNELELGLYQYTHYKKMSEENILKKQLSEAEKLRLAEEMQLKKELAEAKKLQLTEERQLKKKLAEAKKIRLAEERELKKEKVTEANKLKKANELKKKISQITKPKKKYRRKPKFMRTAELNTSELRRSSRGYNHVSYDEEVTDDDELEAIVRYELKNELQSTLEIV